MAKRTLKQKEVYIGRISLLLFWLMAFGGILWLERLARYRYDLILRHWLPWLLPLLGGLSAAAFGVLLFLWLKSGKKESQALFSLPLLMILPLTLGIGFLVPWALNFMNGLQFFRLGADLCFYAALGGYAGYIGFYMVSPAAGPLAGSLTLCSLSLFYFYSRFLSPSAFILNTAEFGYLPAGWVAALLALVVLLGHGLLWFWNRKQAKKLPSAILFAAPALTLLMLLLTAVLPLGITPLRWMIFGSIGLFGGWFILWCLLKKKNIL